MSEGREMPNLNDYLAGAILANGFVWIWSLALGHFSDLFERIPPVILANASYVIYLSGGIVSSYLVCKRASSGHIFVGLKLVALTWAFSIVLMLSIATEPSIGLAIVFLVIFTAGGVAGAYLALRSRLKPRRAQAEASEGG